MHSDSCPCKVWCCVEAKEEAMGLPKHIQMHLPNLLKWRARQNNACSATKCIIRAWENAFGRFPDYRLVYGS